MYEKNGIPQYTGYLSLALPDPLSSYVRPLCPLKVDPGTLYLWTLLTFGLAHGTERPGGQQSMGS